MAVEKAKPANKIVRVLAIILQTAGWIVAISVGLLFTYLFIVFIVLLFNQ